MRPSWASIFGFLVCAFPVLASHLELNHRVLEKDTATILEQCEFQGQYMRSNQFVLFESSNTLKADFKYAVCKNAVLRCFHSQGTMDAEGVEIECPKSTTVEPAQSRNVTPFGLFDESEMYRWKHGVVCFKIDVKRFGQRQREIIRESMEAFVARTNVRFISDDQCGEVRDEAAANGFDICGACENVVEFIKDGTTSCSASVGMQGGKQTILLNDYCFTSHSNSIQVTPMSVVTHELGHVVGLFHEHQHSDRTVKVLWDNIPSSMYANYFELDGFVRTKPYDKSSIMHYGEKAADSSGGTAGRLFCEPKPKCSEHESVENCVPDGTEFCENGAFRAQKCVSIEEKYCQPMDFKVGTADHLSTGDINSINEMYPKAISFEIPSLTQVFTPSNSCSVCLAECFSMTLTLLVLMVYIW